MTIKAVGLGSVGERQAPASPKYAGKVRRLSDNSQDRRLRIIRFIAEFIDRHQIGPTIREICDASGITSTSVVNYFLDQLQIDRFIERTGKISRGLTLTAEGWKLATHSGIKRRPVICPHCHQDINADPDLTPQIVVAPEMRSTDKPKVRSKPDRQTRTPLAV